MNRLLKMNAHKLDNSFLLILFAAKWKKVLSRLFNCIEFKIKLCGRIPYQTFMTLWATSTYYLFKNYLQIWSAVVLSFTRVAIWHYGFPSRRVVEQQLLILGFLPEFLETSGLRKFADFLKKLLPSGFEPGTAGWKSNILTTTSQ